MRFAAAKVSQWDAPQLPRAVALYLIAGCGGAKDEIGGQGGDGFG